MCFGWKVWSFKQKVQCQPQPPEFHQDNVIVLKHVKEVTWFLIIVTRCYNCSMLQGLLRSMQTTMKRITSQTCSAGPYICRYIDIYVTAMSLYQLRNLLGNIYIFGEKLYLTNFLFTYRAGQYKFGQKLIWKISIFLYVFAH